MGALVCCIVIRGRDSGAPVECEMVGSQRAIELNLWATRVSSPGIATRTNCTESAMQMHLDAHDGLSLPRCSACHVRTPNPGLL